MSGKVAFSWCRYVPFPGILLVCYLAAAIFTVASGIYYRNDVVALGLILASATCCVTFAVMMLIELIRMRGWYPLPEEGEDAKGAMALFFMPTICVWFYCACCFFSYSPTKDQLLHMWVVNGVGHYNDTVFALPFYDEIRKVTMPKLLPEPLSLSVTGQTKDGVKISGRVRAYIQLTPDEDTLVRMAMSGQQPNIQREILPLFQNAFEAAVVETKCEDLVNTLPLEYKISRRIPSSDLKKLNLEWSGYLKVDELHILPPN